MIFDYYCMDCGNKFSGGEINFDLAELLGITPKDGNSVVRSRTTQISAAKLKELVRKSASNQKLEHGVKCEVSITLTELLEIMGENAGGKALRTKMGEYAHSDLSAAIFDVFNSFENAEVVSKMVNSYVNTINAKFEEIVDENAGEDDEESDSNDDYVGTFWIIPEFFENGKSDQLYTIKYSNEKDAPAMNTLLAPREIRGYCPTCGQPVIMNAGKYQHVLVGLLGVQSAGKTTAIVGMLEELKDTYESFNISYPEVLCDSREEDRNFNGTLYNNGWAVRKTAVETNAGTFNASVELTSDNGKSKRTIILTFIDIAGEQCFDLKTQTINSSAFQVYPLINSCDLYLLCTCIDQTGFGNAEGNNVFIPKDAPLKIAKGIYHNLRNPLRVPPMCILLTKADMADKAGAAAAANNPFTPIKVNREYLYANQWENLSNTFNSIPDPNIRAQLDWGCKTYNDMKKITYVSMFSCSALGRKGEKDEFSTIDEIVPYKNADGQMQLFTRTRMDVLWKWILQVVGMYPVDEMKKEYLPYIPSFAEHYNCGSDSASAQKDGIVYKVNEAPQRINLVKKVFLNISENDRSIYRASIDGGDSNGGRLGGPFNFFNPFKDKSTPEERVKKEVLKLKLCEKNRGKE